MPELAVLTGKPSELVSHPRREISGVFAGRRFTQKRPRHELRKVEAECRVTIYLYISFDPRLMAHEGRPTELPSSLDVARNTVNRVLSALSPIEDPVRDEGDVFQQSQLQVRM